MTNQILIEISNKDIEEEMTLKHVLFSDNLSASALAALGEFYERMSLFPQAHACFLKCSTISPDNKQALNKIKRLEEAPAGADFLHDKSDRYLMIKGWGAGFWSDFSHALGGLLLSELCNRTPIIYWGQNCRYGKSADGDSFGDYFVNDTLKHLKTLHNMSNISLFPQKWNMSNLLHDNVSKWKGEGSRLSPLFFFNRPENVAVCDFFVNVPSIASMIPASHPMYGKDLIEILQYVVDRYIVPKRHIEECVSRNLHELDLCNGFNAIHLRGTDKIKEGASLVEDNKLILEVAESLEKELPILVLTDDQELAQEAIKRFGMRAKLTNAQRAAGNEGIHTQEVEDRFAIGVEVVVDTYLAVKAERFAGNGNSNLAAAVSILKRWKDDRCILVNPSVYSKLYKDLYRRNM